jgi:hypothetical protein
MISFSRAAGADFAEVVEIATAAGTNKHFSGKVRNSNLFITSPDELMILNSPPRAVGPAVNSRARDAELSHKRDNPADPATGEEKVFLAVSKIMAKEEAKADGL